MPACLLLDMTLLGWSQPQKCHSHCQRPLPLQGKIRGKRMKDSSEKLHRLKSYLYQVMGFFVVEDTILHTTQGLITQEILDDWWAMVLTQMVALLRTACVSVHHGALDCV